MGGILENIGSGLVVIDQAETIIVLNPAAEHLFEVPADGALGRKFRDLDVSYRIDGLRARIEEVRTTQTHAQMQDVVFARRAGDTMHVSIRIAPLFDERRRPTGIMMCVNDMRTVSQLRDELDRLAEQSATANEELQSTNEELETTNEELQSTNEELETTNEELQSTNEELETTVEELQSTNAELTTLNVELERRTTDLHRLEAFERSVLNAIGPALFVIDPSLVVTNWNAAAARLWGVSTEGAVGRDFSSLPSERLVRVAREPLQRVIATHGTERLTGVPRAQVDGAQVDGSVTLDLIPILSAAGELLGVLGAVREGAGEIRGN
ncbi:MAG: PAS domain-containing protein [Deltaproteobacteria bacterium]|nr:MAG: PAS domain-containing protein [Deltaproteobacteria bacterium]